MSVITKARTITTLSAILLATACQNQIFDGPQLSIDTSPVDCGYKWFQTGRSSRVEAVCEAPREEGLKPRMVTQATEQAWSIARRRCPEVCPPRTLRDTSPGKENYPDGVCRNNQVFYHARVFFQCHQPFPVSVSLAY